ncbi:MAG: DNA topoisomerase III, partial [Clostridia bacterium]|nr:DNA topoisomerase III [Clostridia bacterium]
MHNLVIAEKPSVAQAIARVLGADKRMKGYLTGNGYIVSWCVGHLVELVSADQYDPRYKKWRAEDLPIFPAEWKYEITESSRAQYMILRKLLNSPEVDTVICATDAGREGELIFRLVYAQAQCVKPIKRLWISSLEDQAIRDGFADLRDGHEYDNLYHAALCRSHADWLVGINASRLYS